MHVQLLLLFIKAVWSLESLVVVSKYCPLSILEGLQAAIAQDSELSLLFLEPGQTSNFENTDLIFDYTYSVKHSFDLRVAAASFEILLFTPTLSEVRPSHKWMFALHPPANIQAEALAALTEVLDWGSVHLLCSNAHDSLVLAQAVDPSEFFTAPSSSDTVISNFIGKVVKPSGNWRVISTHDAEGAVKVSDSIRLHRIDRERGTLLLTSKAAWGRYHLGTVVLVEEELQDAESQGHYEYLAVKRALTLVKASLPLRATAVAPQVLLEAFSQVVESRVISEAFVVVNYHEDNVPTVIGGVVGSTVTLSGNVVYPGNTTVLNTSPPSLRLSGNTGMYNPDGSFSSRSYYLSLGILPMVSLINADSEFLDNFVLEFQGTDCGNEVVVYDFMESCFEGYQNDLGLLYLQSDTGPATEASMEILEDLNTTIPHIGMSYLEERFYEKTEFPHLVASLPFDVYRFAMMPYILKGIGWDNILFVYQNVSSPLTIPAFLANAEILNMNILNSEESMMITYEYTYEEFCQKNRDRFKYFYDTGGKVLFGDFYYPVDLYVVECLYDIGLRKGDMTIIFSAQISDSIVNPALYAADLEKIKEVADGSLAITFSEYIGEYGESLEEQIAAIIAPLSTTWTCYMIESLMIGVHAVNMMLEIGRDYEDPELLNRFIRMQYYTGCTGTVTIENDGNSRSQYSYQIYNFYEIEGSWAEEMVGHYNMGTTVPLKFTEPITWAGGSTTVPADMRPTDFSCGFDKALAQVNDQSVILSRVTLAVLVSIACLAVLIPTLKNEVMNPEELTERKQMMFEDGVLLILPLVEGLQILGVGPSMKSVNPYLSALCAVAVLDFSETKLLDNWWDAYFLCLSIAVLCVLSAAFLALNVYLRLPKLLRDFIRTICLRQHHICWHIVYMTVLSVLMQVFNCDHSSTDFFEDAYMERACTEKCWEQQHIVLTMVTGTIVTAYIILASLLRPYAEDFMTYSHLKSNYRFASFQAIVKAVLVYAHFALSKRYSGEYTLVYMLVVLVWTALVVRSTPFNYPRLNMWMKVIYLGVAWNGILLVIEDMLEVGQLLMIAQIGVWIVLGAVGVWMQVKKYPSLLYRPKPEDVSKLFRFGLGKKVKATDLKPHELDYVNKGPNAPEN